MPGVLREALPTRVLYGTSLRLCICLNLTTDTNSYVTELIYKMISTTFHMFTTLHAICCATKCPCNGHCLVIFLIILHGKLEASYSIQSKGPSSCSGPEAHILVGLVLGLGEVCCIHWRSRQPL